MDGHPLYKNMFLLFDRHIMIQDRPLIANGRTILNGVNAAKVARVVFKQENEPQKYWLETGDNPVAERLEKNVNATPTNAHVCSTTQTHSTVISRLLASLKLVMYAFLQNKQKNYFNTQKSYDTKTMTQVYTILLKLKTYKKPFQSGCSAEYKSDFLNPNTIIFKC